MWYLRFCGPKLPSTVRMLPYQMAFTVKRYILKSTERSRLMLWIIDLIFTVIIIIIIIVII